MKKSLFNIQKILNIYNNPKTHYKFDYVDQEINVFFGKNILYKCLKKILKNESPRFFNENIFKIRSLKDEIENRFFSNDNSKYIITLGGADVIEKGKIIRNEDKNTRLISVPTSCSNDAFFTNRYKKDSNLSSAALNGLMPDFLIVDMEMIRGLVTGDLVYAGWGEFLALITSYNDWRENNKDLVEKEDLELLDELIDKMFKDARDFFKKERDIKGGVDILMHLLFIKCLFMMIYNDNSIGASSDHMFAYGMEKLDDSQNLKHGLKVLFGAIISSECYSILCKKKLIELLPKRIIDYVLDQEYFKELLNPQDLKMILNNAILSRPRKTIFDKVPVDNKEFYEELVRGVKNL